MGGLLPQGLWAAIQVGPLQQLNPGLVLILCKIHPFTAAINFFKPFLQAGLKNLNLKMITDSNDLNSDHDIWSYGTQASLSIWLKSSDDSAVTVTVTMTVTHDNDHDQPGCPCSFARDLDGTPGPACAAAGQ